MERVDCKQTRRIRYIQRSRNYVFVVPDLLMTIVSPFVIPYCILNTQKRKNGTAPNTPTSSHTAFDGWDNPYVLVRFHCRVCDKELPNKNYWKTHHGLHSNSYKCGTCGRAFGTASNLKRHEKSHVKKEDNVVKQERSHANNGSGNYAAVQSSHYSHTMVKQESMRQTSPVKAVLKISMFLQVGLYRLK